MVIVALLAGANVIFTRFLNAEGGRYNGIGMSTLLNYATGLMTSLLLLAVMGGPGGSAGMTGFRAMAMYAGGALGVVLILISNYIAPRMPAFLMTLLLSVSQMLAGAGVDYLLTRRFSIADLVGSLLVLLGLIHYQWVNRQQPR
ncbi:MAG: hypothetical protein EOM66_11465 [Clostridia bacterium]|nr:hypothetical protein [Clostridia bacterium]